MASQAQTAAPHPDELMEDINEFSMTRSLAIAFVAHVAIIGLTSIGFLIECAEYGTMSPTQIVVLKREREEAAKKAAEEAKAAAEKDAKGEGKAGAAATATAGPAKGKGKRKSGIMETLQESSTDRPEEPDATLDDADLLK